ncbi:MAG: glycosyltransferase family 2 protein [Cellvibrionaceae bacterium]|nr:glycosyltransferase family 2 protein [Cellvibrionaceae bacterium]
MATNSIECSIIIPAFNESNVIERCLSKLLEGLDLSRCEIIVVANGCKDDTVEKAQKFPGVQVENIAQASKVAALNTGDKLARGKFRAYIDADILLSGSAVITVLDYLQANSHIKVAAPKIQFDLSHSSLLVKAFYSVWKSLPYMKDPGLVGSGVFILSPSGRDSFAEFPALISDDGYVRTLFRRDERAMVEQCRFTVFAPNTVADLIKIKTRVRLGNLELKRASPTAAIGGENTLKAALKTLIVNPWLIPAAMVYFHVQKQTKTRALIRFKNNEMEKWDRDNGSRANV